MKPNSVVVLTGAGTSAESGLKTFRDNDGLWEGHHIEEVATPEAYAASPQRVHRFYNQRRLQLFSGEVQPNAAHAALAHFEKHWQGNFLLVTQNVDNLHERAGSVRVLHMHGQLNQVRCVQSGDVFHCTSSISQEDSCSCCAAIGTLRPNIVWFGEMPMFMDQIEEHIRQCDLFVSIGTSGAVYPAAGFSRIASAYGATTVELNVTQTLTSNQFDQCVQGPASEVVPKFFNQLLADH